MKITKTFFKSEIEISKEELEFLIISPLGKTALAQEATGSILILIKELIK